jgi:hypothetical protein
MSKVVLILGAGASVPFIHDSVITLNTNYLTDMVHSDTLWKFVLRLYDKRKCNKRKKDEKLKVCDNLSHKSIKKVIGIIDEVLLKVSSNKKVEKNSFEYIIHLFDRVSDILWSIDAPQDINIDGLLAYYFGVKTLESSFPNDLYTDGWLVAPFLAREVIAKSIIDLWGKTSNKSESISNIRDFFKKIGNNFDQINVYSFNYDPLIHFATKEMNFENGFTENGFSPQSFLKADNTVAYLHGNIGFFPNNNTMSFNDNWEKTQKKRIEGLWKETSHYSLGRKGIYMNSFLITGLDKSEAFTQQPFSSYIFRFSRDIEKADVILIIGSSLQDTHVLHLLLNSRYYNVNKYVIVTKDNHNNIVDQIWPKNLSGNELVWQCFSLLDPNLVSHENSPKDFIREQKTRISSELTSSKFASISEKCLLYIDGTESFIKDFCEFNEKIFEQHN